MSLPKLYTLETTEVVGYLRNATPNIYCGQCRRRIAHYQTLELVLDVWPKCDLIAAKGGEYFVSARLLDRLTSLKVHGFLHQPVSVHLSEDFHRLHLDTTETPAELAGFHYLIITGRCDGPWLLSDQGEPCPVCGQPRPILKRRLSFDELEAVRLGDTAPLPTTLVFTDTWHDEDIFYLTETRKPIITERLAAVLADTGNLRKESVETRDSIRRFTPKVAARLEKFDWQTPTCSVLGPADWVNR